MKITELKKKAEALDKLQKLPKMIHHSKLADDGGHLGWVPEKKEWRLTLDIAIGKTQHESNSGDYRLAYVLYGWEGEEQALPFGEKELEEQLEYDCIMYFGGLYGNRIEDLVDRMISWLDSQSGKWE